MGQATTLYDVALAALPSEQRERGVVFSRLTLVGSNAGKGGCEPLKPQPDGGLKGLTVEYSTCWLQQVEGLEDAVFEHCAALVALQHKGQHSDRVAVISHMENVQEFNHSYQLHADYVGGAAGPPVFEALEDSRVTLAAAELSYGTRRLCREMVGLSKSEAIRLLERPEFLTGMPTEEGIAALLAAKSLPLLEDFLAALTDPLDVHALLDFDHVWPRPPRLSSTLQGVKAH